MIVDTEYHCEELIQKKNYKEGNSASSTELIPFDFNYEYQPIMAQMKLKSKYQNNQDDSGSTKRLTINNLVRPPVSLKISIQKAHGSVADEMYKTY